MKIGIYIDNNWIPAFLTINDQGIIIKMENKSIIIMFKEIIRLHLNDQKFIEILNIGMNKCENIKQQVKQMKVKGGKLCEN